MVTAYSRARRCKVARNSSTLAIVTFPAISLQFMVHESFTGIFARIAGKQRLNLEIAALQQHFGVQDRCTGRASDGVVALNDVFYLVRQPTRSDPTH
jgi:hypothetical protein